MANRNNSVALLAFRRIASENIERSGSFLGKKTQDGNLNVSFFFRSRASDSANRPSVESFQRGSRIYDGKDRGGSSAGESPRQSAPASHKSRKKPNQTRLPAGTDTAKRGYESFFREESFEYSILVDESERDRAKRDERLRARIAISFLLFPPPPPVLFVQRKADLYGRRGESGWGLPADRGKGAKRKRG